MALPRLDRIRAGGLTVVSITDPGSSDARVPTGFGPVLRLKFDDLDTEVVAQGSIGQLFSEADASAVVSFLDRDHASTDCYGLVVHCERGRSRSAAIAWYALSYGGHLAKERRIDGLNVFVLQRLEAAGGRQLPLPGGILVPAAYAIRRPMPYEA